MQYWIGDRFLRKKMTLFKHLIVSSCYMLPYLNAQKERE
jgi:hypothetical protein